MSFRDNPGYQELLRAMAETAEAYENAPDAELRAARMRRAFARFKPRWRHAPPPFPHPFEDWNCPEDSVYDDDGA